jgi:hypothetical protein
VEPNDQSAELEDKLAKVINESEERIPAMCEARELLQLKVGRRGSGFL